MFSLLLYSTSTSLNLKIFIQMVICRLLSMSFSPRAHAAVPVLFWTSLVIISAATYATPPWPAAHLELYLVTSSAVMLASTRRCYCMLVLQAHNVKAMGKLENNKASLFFLHVRPSLAPLSDLPPSLSSSHAWRLPWNLQFCCACTNAWFIWLKKFVFAKVKMLCCRRSGVYCICVCVFY